jgi:hypothetical protein
VVWIPFTVCCAPEGVSPLEYRKDSRLLIVRGARNEQGNGTYFYALTHEGFVLINAQEAPPPH